MRACMCGVVGCSRHGGRNTKRRLSGRPMSKGWPAIRARHLTLEPDCRVCGAEAVTVDHITARARGGTDEDSNLRSLCARHAKVKDDRDAAEGRRIANQKRKKQKR
jgi:5-methylcytosine-specific restriction endonuclease McrA